MGQLTRREWHRLTLGGLAAAAAGALPRTARRAAAESRFGGVLIGLQSFSFRDMTLDEGIAAMQQLGITSCELWELHVEPRELRRPENRERLRRWRTTVPLDHFAEIGAPLRGRRHRPERLQPQLQGPLLRRRDRPRLRDGGGARGPGHHGVGADEQRPPHRPLRRALRHAGGDAQPFPHRSQRVRDAGRLRAGDGARRRGPHRRQPRHRTHGGGQPRSARLPAGQPRAHRHHPPQGPPPRPGPQHAVGRRRHADPGDVAAAPRRGLGHPGEHRIRVRGRRHADRARTLPRLLQGRARRRERPCRRRLAAALRRGVDGSVARLPAGRAAGRLAGGGRRPRAGRPGGRHRHRRRVRELRAALRVAGRERRQQRGLLRRVGGGRRPGSGSAARSTRSCTTPDTATARRRSRPPAATTPCIPPPATSPARSASGTPHG